MDLILSTTTAWTAGDDNIRYGLTHLLETALPGQDLHCSLFDRNPRLEKRSTTRNSGRDNDQANVLCHTDAWDGFRAVIIAGTPAWGNRNDHLYRQAAYFDVPIYLLGIGSSCLENIQKQLSHDTLAALERATLITARDQLTADFLASRNLPFHHLPCPALFASKTFPTVPPPDRPLGVITSDIPERLEEALQAHRQNPASLLFSHTSYERSKLAQRGHPTIYDHDPRRLLKQLLRFKHIISGRLHAALPLLGAEDGRTAEILPNSDARIAGGFATAKAWYDSGKTTADLQTAYLQILQPALAPLLTSST